MPNNYQQHRYQTGSYNKNFKNKKIKIQKWEKISKTNFNRYTNPLGISLIIFLYISMTFGIFLSTHILTSKQDLSVNVHNYDQNILHSNDSYSLLLKFQNKFQNIIKNFNQKFKINKNSKYHYKNISNKKQKITNGNIQFKLKIATWNKGSTLHQNNMVVLDHVLNKYKPDILNLCEANININLHKFQNDVTDYNIEVTKQSQFSEISRSCLLVHKDVTYDQ